MLKAAQPLLAAHLRAANTSLHLIIKSLFSSLMIVFVVALTLTLPTIFYIFSDNLQRLTKDWHKSEHISLYLKTSLSHQQQQTVLDKVSSIEGVQHAHLKSPEEGLNELKKQEGMNDIMRYLPENPLPAVIEVVPAFNLSHALPIKQLFSTLQALPEVQQAKLDLEWVNRLNMIIGFFNKTTTAIMVFLALAVIFIIGNTLRFATRERQDEIRVLKLIGANDAFIARPFLYSGIWYSIAGAVMAILFVNLFILFFSMMLNKLTLTYPMEELYLGLTVKQAYLILFLSSVLGWLGARLSVNQELASIEPCG